MHVIKWRGIVHTHHLNVNVLTDITVGPLVSVGFWFQDHLSAHTQDTKICRCSSPYSKCPSTVGLYPWVSHPQIQPTAGGNPQIQEANCILCCRRISQRESRSLFQPVRGLFPIQVCAVLALVEVTSSLDEQGITLLSIDPFGRCNRWGKLDEEATGFISTLFVTFWE